MKKKLFSAGAVAWLLGLCAMSSAQGLDGEGTAGVTVLKALTLTELSSGMSWGSVARPGNGTAEYTLGYNTGAVTLTNTTSTAFPGFAWDDGNAGEWAVTGEPSTGISFSVAIGAFDGTGVSVVAAHINGTSSSGTGTLDGNGDYTLQVGGIIAIASNASLGAHSATVTVSVDYS
jgi:hypothetical protein